MNADTMFLARVWCIRRLDPVAIARMVVVMAVLLAAACAIAAEVPAAIAPQPIISRGVPAYASSRWLFSQASMFVSLTVPTMPISGGRPTRATSPASTTTMSPW